MLYQTQKQNRIFHKIIAAIIVQIFILTNTAYPSPYALRPPVLFSKTQEELSFLGNLSPKIDLSRLIGLLKELSKKSYDNEYYLDLVNNPDELIRMVDGFKGKPERLDTLIRLQSSYKRQAAIELIANAIDALMAENGTVLIGRFGIGAFQSLAELEDKDDYVSWTTSSDGKQALRIVITKDKGKGQYDYQCKIITQGVKKGTTVKVHKARYSQKSQDSLKRYIRV